MRTGATSSDKPQPSIATIGFFDGVHLGHRYLIRQTCEAARQRGLQATVVTFPVHPRQVMQPDFHPDLLTTCREKEALLAESGIDRCLMLDFTPQLARLTALQFMTQLKEQHGIEAMMIGYDHRFGHNRSEGFPSYVRYGDALGIEVLPAQAYQLEDGTAVSSSRLRQLLKAGDIRQASRELGYDYFLNGTVVTGHRVGRTIGYPTANLQADDPYKLVPANGVYAVRVRLQAKEYAGMLSIGHRPTLANGPERSIEVHILDFSGDIYGQALTLTFIERIREERRFTSVEELTTQLKRDERAVRHLQTAYPEQRQQTFLNKERP